MKKASSVGSLLIALMAMAAVGTSVTAHGDGRGGTDFTMGNYDHRGSRDIPASHNLNRKVVKKYGFRTKWYTGAPTVPNGPDGIDGATSTTVATMKHIVMVGDTSGYMYGLHKDNGSVLWKTCIDPHGEANDCSTSGGISAGILGNPAVSGHIVYQGTLSGKMVALDVYSGAILWSVEAGLNPPLEDGSKVDSVWGGTIVIDNKDLWDSWRRDHPGQGDHLIQSLLSLWRNGRHHFDGGIVVFGTSPADQFGPLPNGEYARGGLVALDKHTGALVWRTHTITPAEFAAGASGAGFWLSAPTFSKDLGLIYIGTGQDRNPGNTGPPDFDPDPLDSSAGSDSIFAFDARTGKIAWQTQVRDTDSWNTTIPFNPLEPVDTDISNSPSVFYHRGRPYVAAGDKRGIFWVMNAKTGRIVNNGGLGLDMFGDPPGIPSDANLPGPGLRGGFNLDSGYFMHGGKAYHFGTYADLGEGFRVMIPGDPLYDPVLYPDGECDVAPGPSRPGCPEKPVGNLVILDQMGENVLCRFVLPTAELFTSFHVDRMILTRSAGTNTLYALDLQGCDDGEMDVITSMVTPVPSLGLGSAISIADGVIYNGGGFFSQAVDGVGIAAIEVAKP